MLGSRGKMAMLGALVMGMGSAANAMTITPSYEPHQLARAQFGVYNPHAPMTYGNRGAGITMAQQKRASQKRKNVQRHRRHVRG